MDFENVSKRLTCFLLLALLLHMGGGVLYILLSSKKTEKPLKKDEKVVTVELKQEEKKEKPIQAENLPPQQEPPSPPLPPQKQKIAPPKGKETPEVKIPSQLDNMTQKPHPPSPPSLELKKDKKDEKFTEPAEGSEDGEDDCLVVIFDSEEKYIQKGDIEIVRMKREGADKIIYEKLLYDPQSLSCKWTPLSTENLFLLKNIKGSWEYISHCCVLNACVLSILNQDWKNKLKAGKWEIENGILKRVGRCK
jgi:hypothetical protein